MTTRKAPQEPPPCIEFGSAGGVGARGADDALAGEAGVAVPLPMPAGASLKVSGKRGGSDGAGCGTGGADAGGGTDGAGITYWIPGSGSMVGAAALAADAGGCVGAAGAPGVAGNDVGTVCTLTRNGAARR